MRACRCRMSASENSFERALYNQQEDDICKLGGKSVLPHFINENYNIAPAMSSSRADSVLGHCPGWEYLNIYISVSALAGGI